MKQLLIPMMVAFAILVTSCQKEIANEKKNQAISGSEENILESSGSCIDGSSFLSWISPNGNTCKIKAVSVDYPTDTTVLTTTIIKVSQSTDQFKLAPYSVDGNFYTVYNCGASANYKLKVKQIGTDVVYQLGTAGNIFEIGGNKWKILRISIKPS